MEESYSALTWSLTWGWLNWRERETPGLLSHFRMVIGISRQIQEQNRKHSKALLFGLSMFDQCKKSEQKISCECTFKMRSTSELNSLKDTFAPDFWILFFFSSKAPTWSPDSYPELVSNVKSNSLRYSNYSSLCVDSVNVKLIFCFKLYKNC